jgi:hypothetical protein
MLNFLNKDKLTSSLSEVLRRTRTTPKASQLGGHTDNDHFIIEDEVDQHY